MTNIKNYEGLYQINEFGVIRSLPKKATYKGQSYLEGRDLKQEIIKKDHTNYRRVSLSKNSKVQRFSVHRLVAETFIDNPYNKPHVNHIDNNGENNHVSNLEWVTHSENMLHAAEQGRLDKSYQNSLVKHIVKVNIQTEEKLKLKFGSNFIKLTKELQGKKVRKYLTYTCSTCGTELRARIDAPKLNHGLCQKCLY